MTPLFQIILILFALLAVLTFGYYQLCRTIEDVENQPIGGNQKDYRVFKFFSRKKTLNL